MTLKHMMIGGFILLLPIASLWAQSDIEARKAELEQNPSDPARNYNLGNAYLAAQRYVEAVSCYDKAIALKSDYPEAWNNKGIAHRRAGQAKEAAAALERAVKIKPDYLEALLNLGGVYEEQSLFRKAALTYKKALAFRTDADMYLLLANVWRKAGSVDAAA